MCYVCTGWGPSAFSISWNSVVCINDHTNIRGTIFHLFMMLRKNKSSFFTIFPLFYYVKLNLAALSCLI